MNEWELGSLTSNCPAALTFDGAINSTSSDQLFFIYFSFDFLRPQCCSSGLASYDGERCCASFDSQIHNSYSFLPSTIQMLWKEMEKMTIVVNFHIESCVVCARLTFYRNSSREEKEISGGCVVASNWNRSPVNKYKSLIMIDWEICCVYVVRLVELLVELWTFNSCLAGISLVFSHCCDVELWLWWVCWVWVGEISHHIECFIQ